MAGNPGSLCEAARVQSQPHMPCSPYEIANDTPPVPVGGRIVATVA